MSCISFVCDNKHDSLKLVVLKIFGSDNNALFTAQIEEFLGDF